MTPQQKLEEPERSGLFVGQTQNIYKVACTGGRPMVLQEGLGLMMKINWMDSNSEGKERKFPKLD